MDRMTEKDPVCGKEISHEFETPSQRQYLGQTFRFCSEQCAEEFEKEPDSYLQEEFLKAQSGYGVK